MDEKQQGIITLIRSAISGETLPLPEGFTLGDAMEQIGRHGLQTLCYQGAFHCGISRSDPTMMKLFQSYCLSMMHSEGQMASLRQLFWAFEEAGIDYLPLKGTILKPLYPKPELRSMGDADILIRMDQYDRIAPVMESLGYSFAKETDHEYIWHTKTLLVELHKLLIPSYNKDYYDYYGDGWGKALQQQGHCYAMGCEDAYLYIFSHYAKHYRDGGIGCRHVTDLWVWRRNYPDMDESYIRRELEKMQLDVFYDNTQRLLAAWFQDAPGDAVTEFMTGFIFASGNFGLDEVRTLSHGVKTAKTADSVKKEWFRQLFLSLFPGREIMQKQYPCLKKCPWLLPLFWLIRLPDKLLFQRKDVKARQKSLQALTAKNVDAHRKALQFVGLDYNF